MKVVMASNNAHKIAELRAILSAYGLDVVCPPWRTTPA